jgi:hypothetical protein
MAITREDRSYVPVLGRVDAAGALSVCAYGLLAVLSRGRQEISITAFLGIMFAAWVLLAFACTNKETISAKKIWFWAIAFRLVGFFAEPVLEDDWYRYLWDGAVFASTGNPYGKPPNLFFGDPSVLPGMQRILDGINHPDVPTIYGPVCQLMFLISYWIAPGQLWPLKVMLLVADLAGIAAVSRLITKHTRDTLAHSDIFSPPETRVGWRAFLSAAIRRRCCTFLLYAWCPLLVKEVAFTAHPDIVAIVLLLAALLVQRPRNVAILCAVAVATKAFAILIAVLLLLRLPKKHWLTFVGVLAGLYLPFWLQGNPADLAGLKAFATEWEFNSTLYGVIGIWAGAEAARLICGILFVLLYSLYAWKWKGGIPRGDWIFGVFFLLSAVVNPWYLLWMLPFVALFPTAAGVAALIVVSVAYAHGLNLPGSDLGPYDHPAWVRVVELVTIFVAGSLQYLEPTRQTRA